MIALFAVAAAALAVPPAPSGRDLPFGSVEVVDPAAPALARYMRCVREGIDRRGGIRSDDRALHRRNVDAAIADCTEIRASAVAEADAALVRAPDYADPARRSSAIRHAFEGSEQQQRDMPAIMEQERRTRSAEVRGGSVNIPPEIARQVLPYFQCTTERTSARLPASTAEALRSIRAAAIADCADVRRQGFEEADQVLRRYRSLANEARRHAFINDAFDQIDRAYEPLAERLESLNASARAAEQED